MSNDPFDRDPEYETPSLGPCCACGRSDPEVWVRNIIMLQKKSQIPGHGWAWVVCGLPPDGATAVLCDECLGSDEPGHPLAREPRFACRGLPATEGRIPIEDLTGIFGHDEEKHTQFERRPTWNPQ